MRTRLFILIALTSLSSCSQKTQNDEKVIINELTSNHVNLVGTNISLIPPDGYIVSDQYPSITKDNFGINVMDVQGGNFESNTRNMTRENFEAKGITVHDFQRLTINDYDAVYVDIDADARSFILVIGDSTFSTSITGTAPKDNLTIHSEIKSSIMSIYYDRENEFDPFDLAQFELDLSGSNFQFSNYAANMFFYKSEDIETSTQNTGATLIIAQYPSDSEYFGKLNLITDQMLNGLSNQGAVIDTYDKGYILIDSMEAHYTKAETYIQKKRTELYYVSMMNANTIFSIQAAAYDNPDENIREMERLINSLKIKK